MKRLLTATSMCLVLSGCGDIYYTTPINPNPPQQMDPENTYYVTTQPAGNVVTAIYNPYSNQHLVITTSNLFVMYTSARGLLYNEPLNEECAFIGKKQVGDMLVSTYTGRKYEVKDKAKEEGK